MAAWGPVRFLDRFRKFQRPPAPAGVTLRAIGWVRNDVAKPRPHGWESVESRIELLTEHTAKADGLAEYSHVIVVFVMDLAADAPEKPERLTVDGVEVGILATRSQLRPNHLGVAAVPLLAADGGALRVRGLDAIDGTPVLDVKPYLPRYDAYPDATIPGA